MTTTGRGRWTSRLRPLTIAVFTALAVISILISTLIGRIAEQQDHRLLVEQTSEAAVVLESTLNEIKLSFPYLAGIVQLTPEPDQAFELAAGAVVSTVVRSVGMAEPVGDSYETTTVVGEGPAVGQPLDPDWTALLDRAEEEQDVVTGALPRAGAQGTTVGFAYAAEGLPVLMFMELLFEPTEMLVLEEGSPFSELSGHLYVGLEADEANLVLTTADGPLQGDVIRDTVDVGADDWLLLTATDGSRVGPLAQQVRWGVMVGGVVLALITAALVEMLSQRRAYALRLVEQRTAELEVAREVAEDANRSKSEFLSRMSHELRTPLNAVLGFGQLLEIEPLAPEQHESVDQILKGGRHLLDLINEVLDISRIETGELSLSHEAVHAGDLIEETLDLIRPVADQSGIQIVRDRSGACDCYVFADHQRTKQVLLNLLSNAVKYNRAKGTVALSCSRPTDTLVRISVTDTGPGIPAEQLDKLFTPFERLGAEHTAVEGIGIGLALSQKLAGAMDGRLGVDSTLGRGSTFYLELPRVEGPVDRYERLNGDRATAAPAGPATGVRSVVLHIEDNLSNLALVERIVLQRPEVEVVAAMHGSLGLELAREHSPALVLLDLHLPDMGGEQVLQRLRDDPATASIPVVIVSADATPGQIQRLLSAGASAYLTKPIQVRDLIDALDEAIAGRAPEITRSPGA